MDTSTVLIVVDADRSDTTLNSFIKSIPDQGVHASFLVVGAAEPLPIWAYGSAPYGPVIFPEEWQRQYQTSGQAIADMAERIEDMLLRAGTAGDVRSAFCEAASLDEAVAAQSALSDFVFLDPSLSENKHVFEAPLRGALFQSPVGVVLNSTEITPVLNARHPFVAWNTSPPATRAVHRALPILKQAEAVTIALFDPPTHGSSDSKNAGSDVATWLSRHGCNVTVQHYPSGGKEIGTCILERASETGADLIVMGAYSHSRIRQLLLGGTTQTMIEQSRYRVLLAH